MRPGRSSPNKVFHATLGGMTRMAKDRVPIPPEIAAELLFASDHTCCVCRDRGRAVQIHHIDEDPANNTEENLSVLCLLCHDDTQRA